MINQNRAYCFKSKDWIDRNTCNRCELYYRICRNLYKRGQKCFEPSETLGEYEIYRLQELIKKIRRTLMISTKEVMKFLTKKYNLEIDQSLIFKYATKGLIKKEQKIGQGKSKGVQTFWENSAPGKVYIIKQLLKDNFKFTEIVKFWEIIYNKPLKYFQAIIRNPVKSLEIAKLYTVAAHFAAAEAEIDFNQYSFLKNLSYEVYPNTDPLTVKLRDLEALTKLNKDSGDFEWKPIKTVTFKKGSVTIT